MQKIDAKQTMATLNSVIIKSTEMCSYMCVSQVIYRKFALKLALVLLIAICLWMHYQISTGDHTRASKCHCQAHSKYHYRLDKTRKKQLNKILIITEARSGSSFLGDLLQHASSTYYSFEPLIGVEPNSSLYHTLIFDIFNCQFDHLRDTYLKPIYWKIQYFKWNALLADYINPRDSMQLFNQTTHRLLCTNSEAILVKTIRFTLTDYLKTIRSIVETKKLAIKVIYLARDPRAVMSSRYRMAWCQQTENCTNSEVLCQRMRININALKEIRTSKLSPNIALIRHEDLLLDMLNSATKLLQFLQMDSMDQRLVEWIQSHTSADDVLSNPHSTYRNIKLLASQWKGDLTPEELIEIEENCQDVMQQLGYRPLVVQQANQIEEAIEHKEILESLESDYPLREVSVCKQVAS